MPVNPAVSTTTATSGPDNQIQQELDTHNDTPPTAMVDSIGDRTIEWSPPIHRTGTSVAAAIPPPRQRIYPWIGDSASHSPT
ncbi:hypothetical protein OH799_18660 [Nocardia sp. NBC_00881]|uniref:hypothetical protein n=1 Tax=Nocardia sp. NBC_00881 TaxID=2975995 RepID=UPI0038698888|nr:hypothetical protein OH799_18660 [Nocardia sp. NBC_00881]